MAHNDNNENTSTMTRKKRFGRRRHHNNGKMEVQNMAFMTMKTLRRWRENEGLGEKGTATIKV